MANPAGERAVLLKRPLRVGLRFFCVTLALTGVLLAGCGSGDDRAKVEASLRHYIGTLTPDSSAFPGGLGLLPRVRHNSCEDRHVKTKRGEVLQLGVGASGSLRMPEGHVWSCVVTVGKSLTLPALAIVNSSTEVVGAIPVPFEAFEFAQRCAGRSLAQRPCPRNLP